MFFSKRQTNVHVFVRKKTEKICAALFLVTDFLPHDDLFRDTIRAKGLGLLDGLDQSDVAVVRAHLGTIGSLCSMAQWAGVLSPMNVRILIDECNALETFMTTHEQMLTSPGMLSLELFETELETQTGIPLSKGHATDVVIEKVPAIPSVVAKASHKRQGDDGGIKRHLKEENKEKQRDRRATILAVLQKKDRINVKDVAEVITDCSEKTLQRELLSLVAQGVLKKEGERRWSTYTLAGI